MTDGLLEVKAALTQSQLFIVVASKAIGRCTKQSNKAASKQFRAQSWAEHVVGEAKANPGQSVGTGTQRIKGAIRHEARASTATSHRDKGNAQQTEINQTATITESDQKGKRFFTGENDPNDRPTQPQMQTQTRPHVAPCIQSTVAINATEKRQEGTKQNQGKSQEKSKSNSNVLSRTSRARLRHHRGVKATVEPNRPMKSGTSSRGEDRGNLATEQLAESNQSDVDACFAKTHTPERHRSIKLIKRK